MEKVYNLGESKMEFGLAAIAFALIGLTIQVWRIGNILESKNGTE